MCFCIKYLLTKGQFLRDRYIVELQDYLTREQAECHVITP